MFDLAVKDTKTRRWERMCCRSLLRLIRVPLSGIPGDMHPIEANFLASRVRCYEDTPFISQISEKSSDKRKRREKNTLGSHERCVR